METARAVRSLRPFGVLGSSEFGVRRWTLDFGRWTLDSELPPTPNSELFSTPNSPGFTLLEVLVALAVLAVALVSLLGLQNRNLLLSMQAERLSTGTLLVREMLTRTQLEGPDAGRVTSGDFAETHPRQYPEFRWHRTIRPAQLDGLWEIQVGVTWGDRADERAELTLFTPLS